MRWWEKVVYANEIKRKQKQQNSYQRKKNLKSVIRDKKGHYIVIKGSSQSKKKREPL